MYIRFPLFISLVSFNSERPKQGVYDAVGLQKTLARKGDKSILSSISE